MTDVCDVSQVVRGVLRFFFFFFQAEDGIRDVERSRGLGDVYKRQDYSGIYLAITLLPRIFDFTSSVVLPGFRPFNVIQ